METTTDPRTTVPETAGRYRPLRDVKPGWWVYLKRTRTPVRLTEDAKKRPRSL